MPEFMLLIYNIGEFKENQTPEVHKEFVKKCENYIGKLKEEKKLIAAQPIARQGKIISGKKGAWKENPFDKSKEVQVGYYHILAKNLDEAVEIAKANPEFEYGNTAKIEVRPIKMMEETTGFVYPKNI